MLNWDYPVKRENSDSELKKMKRSETNQHQLKHSDLNTGTKRDSVFEQIKKFVQFWKDGQKASFKIECENGDAVMNMSVCLKSSRKT